MIKIKMKLHDPRNLSQTISKSKKSFVRRLVSACPDATFLPLSSALQIVLVPKIKDHSVRLEVLQELRYEGLPRLRELLPIVSSDYSRLGCEQKRNRIAEYSAMVVDHGLGWEEVRGMTEVQLTARVLAVDSYPRVCTSLVEKMLQLDGKNVRRFSMSLPTSHSGISCYEQVQEYSAFAKDLLVHCDIAMTSGSVRTADVERNRKVVMQQASYFLKFLVEELDEDQTLEKFLLEADVEVVQAAIVAYAETQEITNEAVRTHTKRHSARNVVVFCLGLVKRALAESYMPLLKHHTHKLTCKGILGHINNRRIEAPADLRRTFSSEELVALRAACLTPRDTLLLEVLVNVALRNAAVSRLKNKDLWDTDKREPRKNCRVLEKGNKWREFRSPPGVQQAMRAFVRTFPGQELYIGNAENPRAPMGERMLHRWLRKLAQRAGVKGMHVHPQAFRHTIVDTMVDHGVPMDDISRFLGHSSVSTTMKNYWTSDIKRLVGTMQDPFGENLEAATADVELALYRTKKQQVIEIIHIYQDGLTQAVNTGETASRLLERLGREHPQMNELLGILAEG
jgi:integrase